MKSCKVIQELVRRIKVWTVSQVIRRVFTVAQQEPLRLRVNFQLQLWSLPNKQWLYRSTNCGIHTVITFLAASSVADVRRQNCDIIIVLHHTTHFEDLPSLRLPGMLLHRCVRFLLYTTCARIAVYVIYTEDCPLPTSNFRYLHVLCSTKS